MGRGWGVGGLHSETIAMFQDQMTHFSSLSSRKRLSVALRETYVTNSDKRVRKWQCGHAELLIQPERSPKDL